MEIYFDNSATTACSREVADLIYKINTQEYGNPSSMHHAGVVAEKYIRTARESIASTLKVKGEEILFTSGGTESDNLAILGAANAYKRKGNHIITTNVEHPAVLQTVKALGKQGFEITYLGVDKEGIISLGELEKALREDTILVSIMHTNNEIGSLMPIGEAGELIKKKNPEIIFHVDGVQGYGKSQIFPIKQKIDLLSVSGHKIHGPKGIGFLYKNPKVRLVPMVYGGGQQKDLRPGTENVSGIAGLGLAASMAYEGMEKANTLMKEIKAALTKGFEALDDICINSPGEGKASTHILNASFLGVRSEVLLHALEDKGVYVSAGSACASNKRDSFSDTLKALGLSKERMDCAIRFSFSEYNTVAEAKEVLKILAELLPVLRRYR